MPYASLFMYLYSGNLLIYSYNANVYASINNKHSSKGCGKDSVRLLLINHEYCVIWKMRTSEFFTKLSETQYFTPGTSSQLHTSDHSNVICNMESFYEATH